jgi:MFS family permease
MLVVGRFIGGVGIGLLSSTAPMYISEIAPPNVRGALLALEGSTIVIGIVIMFYIVSWCGRYFHSFVVACLTCTDLRYQAHCR